MKTKFLILAVFVMILCCTTAVSAAENNMTEVALEDAIDDSGDELSIENTEILKDDEDNRIDAEINVTMPNNMKSGGWYEINVTMPVDADAYIDVYYEDSEEFISDTYIEEGRGQFSFNPPEMGGHYLRLNYYGNEIYNPKVYDIQFDISNYTLSIKDDRVEYSQNILVYLYSPRTFDGTVEVTINNKKYETQKGYENLYFYVNGDDLKLEDNHVNIYYKGDENFAPISRYIFIYV
ncbi:MAG: hypothetical protein E7Z81_00900 [Methanobrevibacter sp.]|uniref:hypothetical protein n=1 Tax=Methanobrevibacter sp. TaxID=66852 RepID=UPI0025D95545|nr:hypothetical protein [Methanobrevibacter sp.]MBE6496833.1 hypothetical protein [Methanobrevibacter sp.]